MSKRVFRRFVVLSLAILALGSATGLFAEEGPVLAPADITAALVVDFKQGSNNNSPNPPGDILWIGSILQATNSVHYEGMSTLQRVLFLNIPATAGNVHSLLLKHQANKSTSHAYDFITSWPQALTAGLQIGGPTMYVALNQCGPNIGPPGNLGAICDALHSGGNTITAAAPDAMGTLLGDDVAASAAAYEASLGNRTVKIYGNAAVTAASMSFDGYSGSGDMYADYTLTWTSSSGQICIELAGHLAGGADPTGQIGVGYGEGKGSSSISGGPYHFKMETLDGASLGSQDNQIKGADILQPPPVCNVTPSSIEICAGGSATFTENTTGGTPPYTYCWTKSAPSGTCLSTTNTLTISNALVSNAGTYYMVVTDANTLKDTCQADLIVNPKPTCSVTPARAERCADGPGVEFCVTP